MSKFPSITPKKLISFLKNQGFVEDHTSGSMKRRVVVPFHRKDLPKGTLFSILKEAGFSKKDYLQSK